MVLVEAGAVHDKDWVCRTTDPLSCGADGGGGAGGVVSSTTFDQAPSPTAFVARTR